MDWEQEVQNYAAKSEQHAARVKAAREQASGLDGAGHWEAVYTLVRQREQMEGVRD